MMGWLVLSTLVVPRGVEKKDKRTMAVTWLSSLRDRVRALAWVGKNKTKRQLQTIESYIGNACPFFFLFARWFCLTAGGPLFFVGLATPSL